MTRDTLDRLRAADPARELDPEAPDALLSALTAAPRPTRHRSRTLRPARVLIPLAAAAAAAVGVVLVPGSSTDLAAQAYAQTAPAPGEILYVRTTVRETSNMPNDHDVNVSTSELWERAGVSRRITRFSDAPSDVDETLNDDGVLRVRFDRDGIEDDTLRRADGGDRRRYIDRVRSGFIASFRRDYERGRLDESSQATFAGRPARRYVVTSNRTRDEYFLDLETGSPLGSEHRITYSPPSGKDVITTKVITIEALDHLPPTPQNLAKLNG